MRSHVHRLSFSSVFAFAGLVTARAADADTAASQPIVTIADGSLAGSTGNEVDVFRGIPFAAPPIGPLRWRVPQPERSWSGVRDATRKGNNCMQPSFPQTMAPLDGPSSEDCLYLNVWRPHGTASSARVPVLVWIHGGGFLNGGASAQVFDGTNFAQKGVILVSINYRLGRFGFFAHPALTRENKDGGLLCNYGYLDQIAALRWVKRNIGAFGGDPENVTLYGESAGGISVQMLMTTPLAHGLFRRAIVQSGGGRGSLLGDRSLGKDRPGVPSLETLGVRFAQKMGITGSNALARLRALPAEELDSDLEGRPLGEQQANFGGPATDGHIVVGPPDDSYRAGTQTGVTLIIGATSADLALGAASSKADAFATFGDKAEDARKIYDPDGSEKTETISRRVASDRIWLEPARYVARLFRAHAKAAYIYRFSYVADSMTSRWPDGAPHASEVPYTMNTVATKYGSAVSERDRAVAETMNSYWANFAKTGNPNGPGLPEWPEYDVASDILMNFTATGEAAAQKDPWKARLDIVAATALRP
jgi:para-nitrobenzyl esterase